MDLLGGGERGEGRKTNESEGEERPAHYCARGYSSAQPTGFQGVLLLFLPSPAPAPPPRLSSSWDWLLSVAFGSVSLSRSARPDSWMQHRAAGRRPHRAASTREALDFSGDPCGGFRITELKILLHLRVIARSSGGDGGGGEEGRGGGVVVKRSALRLEADLISRLPVKIPSADIYYAQRR